MRSFARNQIRALRYLATIGAARGKAAGGGGGGSGGAVSQVLTAVASGAGITIPANGTPTDVAVVTITTTASGKLFLTGTALVMNGASTPATTPVSGYLQVDEIGVLISGVAVDLPSSKAGSVSMSFTKTGVAPGTYHCRLQLSVPPITAVTVPASSGSLTVMATS
jgi:hypothetical protein